MSRPAPVHVPGYGFLTAEGRYYTEAQVRDAALSVSRWWLGMADAQRAALSRLAELARIDREIEAAVFGGES